MTTEHTDPGVVAWRLRDVERAVDDHETRLRAVERAHWRIAGLAGSAAALGAALASWVTFVSYLR